MAYGDAHLLDQRGDLAVRPVEQGGPEVGEVDDEVGLHAGQLLGHAHCGGQRARLRLGVADDDGDLRFGAHRDTSFVEWANSTTLLDFRRAPGSALSRRAQGRQDGW
jgi:hypothetical protein